MYKVKGVLVYILATIINLIIAYSITTFFGIKNTILYKAPTTINHIITYEVIIWFLLILAEAPLLNKFEK